MNSLEIPPTDMSKNRTLLVNGRISRSHPVDENFGTEYH